MRPVQPLLVKLSSAVRLTRLTMAFGAISDVWFVILLTRAAAGGGGGGEGAEVVRMALGAALAAGAIVAVGLFAYGASLNDVLDVRHDSAFRPDRPIPAGRIKPAQAAVVAVAALLVSVPASAAMGRVSLWIMLLVAAAILFYNAAGKYIPPVGIVTIGLIHAAHMLIPNPGLRFTLPVWLVMTHAMGVAAAVHILEDKRPRMGRRALAWMALGWLFWSVLIIGISALRGGLWPADVTWWTALCPAAAVAGFVIVCSWKAGGVHGAVGAEKIRRYGAMWQSLYGAAWFTGLGLQTQAVAMAALAICGFVAMTTVKEITGLSERPVAYR
jgi:4-hydroxybenzoate polyprenyltransferase